MTTGELEVGTTVATDAPIVVKLGGSALKTSASLDKIISQIAALALEGKQVILVHGGGPHISKAMEAHNLKPCFVNGLRVTDDATLMTVYSALGALNAEIVEALRANGVDAAGMHAAPDLFECVKAPCMTLANGNVADLGWVGKIVGVNPGPLRPFNSRVVVVSPIGWDNYRNRFNLNADHAAMALAVALGAGALVFLSDVAGVLTDTSDPSSRVPLLNESNAKDLIESGIVCGGMLPKVDSSLRALKAGVGRVCMADGRQDSALLEVLSNTGRVGTTICA
ncbi:MAG: acetylglutamate kinase [Candidatus Obscuribacterales bacterium]|nr:acetylglutamate kinase [Candidatus Obscuribacterales bacterium]